MTDRTHRHYLASDLRMLQGLLSRSSRASRGYQTNGSHVPSHDAICCTPGALPWFALPLWALQHAPSSMYAGPPGLLAKRRAHFRSELEPPPDDARSRGWSPEGGLVSKTFIKHGCLKLRSSTTGALASASPLPSPDSSRHPRHGLAVRVRLLCPSASACQRRGTLSPKHHERMHGRWRHLGVPNPFPRWCPFIRAIRGMTSHIH